MRRSLVFPLFLLVAGCGGGDSKNDGPIPLSPYGSLTVVPGERYGGYPDPGSFVVVRTEIVDRALVVEANDLASERGRTIVFQIPEFRASKGERHPIDPATFRLAEVVGDGRKVWEADSGEIVDVGEVQGRRRFRLRSLNLVPVSDTGATGTATVDGEFNVELPE